MIVVRRKEVLKRVFQEVAGDQAVNKQIIHERVYLRHVKQFESQEAENNYEDMETYIRIYIYRHLSKYT